ncbi:MAG: restriction endonuclease subunit S [Proteobacteria bacterium]|nr:MAG: restriction endonuclease subunit S [Pseudomonadota bacterium]
MIDISPSDEAIVNEILKKYVPDCEVRVFGSRHKWTSKPYSDLDLAIVGNAKLDKKTLYALQEALEDSELSFRVDVLDWHAISDEFRAIIEQGYSVIQEKETENKLPDGWGVKQLGDVINFNPTEKLPKGSVAKKIAMEKLQPYTRKITNYEIANFTGGSKFKNKDTLLARITPCLENGKTSYVDILEDNEIGFGSTEFIILREKSSITDSKFIYYLSISPDFRDKAIKSMTGSSGRQRVQTDELMNHEMAIPPINEQKEIAAILSSLDDKIELNQQINKKLEEIAQAIFNEWFIDFNFPDENGNPYRDSGGAMINSELGQIPASWSVGKLGDYVDIVGGATPSTKNEKFWNEGSISWSTPKDLSVNKDIFLKDTLKKITDDGLKEISSGLLPIKTLLLSSRAPIGYLAISNINLAINQGYIAILPSSKYDTLFLYVWLKNNMDKVVAMANGSTFQEISKKSFKMIDIVSYPVQLVQQYLDIISKFFEQINLLEIEILNLQDTRDYLLPKLMLCKI